MIDFESEQLLIQEFLERIQAYGQRLWTPATSSNFSLRLGGQVLMTASGVNKQKLNIHQLVRADLAKKALLGTSRGKLSAEADLHFWIYDRFPEARVVLHVHSPFATWASLVAKSDGSVAFEGLELQKAYPGVRTHDGKVDIPVVKNSQDMAEICSELDERGLGALGSQCFLIAGHGVYTWGKDLLEADRILEATEAMAQLKCLLRGAQHGLPL